MASVHIFNPENDLALAAGNATFTPPKGALAVRHAGEPLPLWWAAEDDAVLVSSPQIAEIAEKAKHAYGLCGTIVTDVPPGFKPDPWGWSSYTRRRLIDAGADTSLLPDAETIDNIRQLSHRRTAIAVHKIIGTPSGRLPVEAFSLAEALDTVDRWSDAVVKLPWSSSGRGVIYSSAIPRPTFESYVKGMISRQGSVTIEPRYNRLRDFAMLFYSYAGKVSYRGLSTFSTDSHGFYNGNVITFQKEIARIIGVDITHLIAPLEYALSAVLKDRYHGWLGVDMLVYSSGTEHLIAPCIEINLRRTMGVAAMYIAERLRPESPMTLYVSPAGIQFKPL